MKGAVEQGDIHREIEGLLFTARQARRSRSSAARGSLPPGRRRDSLRYCAMAKVVTLSEESVEDLTGEGEVAVLTLAWALRRQVNERFLLSATLELCELGAAEAFDDSLKRTEISDRFFAFCRRYTLSGRDGLGWFKACVGGNVQLPQAERANTPLLLRPLLSEPPWPQLSSPWDLRVPGALLPAAPGRHASLIPTPSGWEVAFFNETERDAVRQWLGEQLSLDFSVDPELLGAVHLVRLDPDLESVHEERLASDGTGAFRMRIVPKFRGVAATGLTFTLRRQRPHAEESPVSFPLVGEHVLELPHAPFTFSSEVVHERRGLIWREGPALFLDGFNLEAELVVRTREVRIEAVASRAPDAYTVPLVHDPEVITVSNGVSSAMTAGQVLAGNRARAEKRHPPYQQWFDGSADAATPVIRDLIKKTRLEAWLVDPYFDEVELRRFALAVGRTAARIRILTSAEGLRSNARRAGDVAGARLLATAVKAGAAPSSQNEIEIRIMAGSRPDVHDRFLRVDNALWLLGASLNEFGSRGTMLVAVPDPDAILPRIVDEWERATPLKEWMAGRRRRRANPWWYRWWKRPQRRHVSRLGRSGT